MVGASLDKCTDVCHLAARSAATSTSTPGLQGQYSNEYILGAEYEVLPDIKVGINYIHRDLPTIIEDTLVNGGNYFITNPGDNFDSQATRSRRRRPPSSRRTTRPRWRKASSTSRARRA